MPRTPELQACLEPVRAGRGTACRKTQTAQGIGRGARSAAPAPRTGSAACRARLMRTLPRACPLRRHSRACALPHHTHRLGRSCAAECCSQRRSTAPMLPPGHPSILQACAAAPARAPGSPAGWRPGRRRAPARSAAARRTARRARRRRRRGRAAGGSAPRAPAGLRCSRPGPRCARAWGPPWRLPPCARAAPPSVQGRACRRDRVELTCWRGRVTSNKLRRGALLPAAQWPGLGARACRQHSLEQASMNMATHARCFQ